MKRSGRIATVTRSPAAGLAAGSVIDPDEPETAVRLDDRPTRGGSVADDAVDRVGDADEVRDEAVHRAFVELDRSTLLLDPAVPHDDDDVAHRQGLFLVVGHVDEGDPDLALKGLELELHLLAQLEIEGSQRLVEQEHRRVVDQGPGEGDPLLLPARHLPGPRPS